MVVEELDFRKKKTELDGTDPKQAKRLSSFAYNKALSGLKAACFRAGVEVIEVKPAYTSVIDAVCHAQRRGISVYMGAAYAIARRGMGLSERPTVRAGVAPSRNGGHLTFALPERNRAKHIWSFWSKVRAQLGAAHRAHYRSGRHKLDPPPLQRQHPASSALRTITGQSRNANRSPCCWESVLEDVPL